MIRLPLLLSVTGLLTQTPATTADGFAIARPGYVFAFPKDHGSHPAFKTEWWYFTGHLWTAEGRRFGYQLTFFRQAAPKAAWTGSAAWRSDQLLLAHGAITDEQGKRFLVEERLNRAGLAADAAEGRLAVFNEGWRAEQQADGTIALKMQVQGARLELKLTPPPASSGGPVIFGEQGVSRKGADPSAASHYLTFPRLPSEGTLALPGTAPLKLSGTTWMDHEFSSNQLDADQVGWDWVGLTFRDGRSLMAYALRRRDGSQDPWSSITEVDAADRITRSSHSFSLYGNASWTSPASGVRYPQPMTLEAWGRRYRLVPLLPDQELRTPRSTGITYWEGACRVLDERGKEVGDAYLEQTGYAQSLKGRF